MKLLNPKSLMVGVVTLVLSGTSAKAEVILADNFSGVVKTTTNAIATIDAWDTAAGVTAGTNFTAYDLENGTPSVYSVHADMVGTLSVNEAVWETSGVNAGWYISFDDFALVNGSPNVQLDALVLVVKGMGGSGNKTTVDGNREWTVTITGDGAYGTQSATNIAYHTGFSTSVTNDLSSLGVLRAGENYAVKVAVRWLSGSKTYHALDSLSLSSGGFVYPAGTVIITR